MANTKANAKGKFDTQKLVLLALLTAIVFVLQLLAILARPLFPLFTITLVLIPIIIGAALIGVYAGAWLGLAFGFAVLLSGDAAAFLAINVPGTILVVLFKGALAGLASGVVYSLIAKKGRTAAAIVSAAICPIVNTGIFVVGTYLFFLETIKEWGAGAGYENATAYIFLGLVGINFLVELGINIVLCPVIVRLIQYRQDRRAR